MATDPIPFAQQLQAGLWELTAALEARAIHYALIGGLATSYHSQVRFTQDMDFILQVPQLGLPGLLEDLQRRGFDFDMEKTVRAWIQEHMVVLSYHGVRVDWLKPVLPLYQHVLDKALKQEWLGHPIRIATPDGLILTKLIADRRQDRIDIENLLAANAGELDLDWIRQEWATVAGMDDPRMVQFEEMVRQFYLPLFPPPSAIA